MTNKKFYFVVLITIALSTSFVNCIHQNNVVDPQKVEYTRWKRVVDEMRFSENLDYQNYLISYSQKMKNPEPFLRYLYLGWNKYGCWYDLTIVRSFLNDNIQINDDSVNGISRELLEKLVYDLKLVNDPLFARRMACYKNFKRSSLPFDIAYSLNTSDFDVKSVRKNYGSLSFVFHYVRMCGSFGKPEMVLKVNIDNVDKLNDSMIKLLIINHDYFVFDNNLGCFVVDEIALKKRKPVQNNLRTDTRAKLPFPDWNSKTIPYTLILKNRKMKK